MHAPDHLEKALKLHSKGTDAFVSLTMTTKKLSNITSCVHVHTGNWIFK